MYRLPFIYRLYPCLSLVKFPITKSAVRYTTFNWSRKIVTIPSVEITREEATQDAVGRFRKLGCTFLRDSETAPYSNVFQSHTIKRKHPNFIFYDAKSAIRSFKFNSPSCIKVICITQLLYFCSVFWIWQRTNSDVYHRETLCYSRIIFSSWPSSRSIREFIRLSYRNANASRG